MTVLVTGAAGFIGFHVCQALLARGDQVVGIDNMNDYYDVSLKQARLAQLQGRDGFECHHFDIADREAVESLVEKRQDIDRMINLAAQAGVRYSLQNPYAYVTANVMGLVVLMEAARRLPAFRHFVYASSSSVYGGNKKVPFSIEDRVETPISIYAATKRSNELMAHCYAHLYRLPMTGLRFFTVYGPWGRPDMAAYIFARKIMAGEPIPVFNNGDMQRDFTYIDDIVSGVLAALDHPPQDRGEDAVPARFYNLGNHRSESLMRYIALIEQSLGRKAEMQLLPMQPGDVRETYADIDASRRDLGYEPTTPIDEGVPRFISWFRDYHGF